MNALIELITSPTGSLAYHLILAFTVLGALQAVLNQADERVALQRGRLALGLGALLALRGVLFLAAGFAVQGLAGLDLLLPVLDRGVGVLALVVILWLWLAPEPNRGLDAAAIFAVVLVALVTGLGALFWLGRGQVGGLNFSTLGFIFEGLALGLILAGELALLTRRPAGWSTGLAMLVILFLGTLAQLAAPNQGDWAAWMRVAQLAAMPLLFSLSARLHLPVVTPAPLNLPEPASTPATTPTEEPQTSLPKGLPVGELLGILNLGASEKPEEVCQLLTRHLARALVADVALLLSAPDSSGQVVIMCGYDLIREDSLGGGILDQKHIPGYAEAMQRNKPLQVPASSKLDALARALGLKSSGNLLVLPLLNEESKPLAAIVLLSPYSGRVWSAEDLRYIKETGPAVSQLLQKTQRGYRMRENLLTAEARLSETLQEHERLLEEQRRAGEELEALRQSAAESDQQRTTIRELEQELERQRLTASAAGGAVVAGSEALQEENAQLKKELVNFERLKKAAQAVATERDQLRAALEARPDESAPAESMGLSSEQAEVIASIAQDLRQPMSSIIGYTDLLLSESVGILGALQRKFLDRVKASTERMNTLVGNLVQITALDSGNIHITPEAVDLSAVIDQSIGETSNQMREKNIALRVDLAHDLPRMHTDRDAVQQILTHLLSNAGAATPMEGEIALAARHEPANGSGESILLEVRDTGEGIPQEELPRVFSRLYRADNPLIQGVGDTGVGLSIAKTLTEALGGDIWVESDLGRGSTFRVRLPVVSPASNGQNGSAAE